MLRRRPIAVNNQCLVVFARVSAFPFTAVFLDCWIIVGGLHNVQGSFPWLQHTIRYLASEHGYTGIKVSCPELHTERTMLPSHCTCCFNGFYRDNKISTIIHVYRHSADIPTPTRLKPIHKSQESCFTLCNVQQGKGQTTLPIRRGRQLYFPWSQNRRFQTQVPCSRSEVQSAVAVHSLSASLLVVPQRRARPTGAVPVLTPRTDVSYE